MIFDPSTAPHLKPWLVRTLEPICDAEPGALADYILALLKHNVPEGEMRKELATQLDEFLEKAECASFIDTLFTVLRTKSYLPYSATSPPSPSFRPKNSDTGIPIPLDGLLTPTISQTPERNLKRSIEPDEREAGPPAKGSRLTSEGQFSRYSNGHGRPENRSTGGWGDRGDLMGMNGFRDGYDMYAATMLMPGMNGPMVQMNNGRRPQIYQPPDQKRGVCRDYHNNGYCARGAMCKFSHGQDAVVPGIYPMNHALPLPFLPMFAGSGNPFGMGGGMGGAYDPHEARMDMRPMVGRNQRAPLLPRIQQGDGSQVLQTINTTGELPVIQDLTPQDSDKTRTHESTTSDSQLPPSHPAPSQQNMPNAPDGQNGSSYEFIQGRTNGEPYMPTNSGMDVDVNPELSTELPHNRHANNIRPTRGVGRGRGRGGTFGGEIHSLRPERRSDKTLVVEKIPEDKLTLEHVNDWFKRFGKVTNVAIDGTSAKALISFSSHEEAYAAWKSEDAVFNNRFVKLFWHRPMEGHGQVGAKMLAASAPLVANILTKESNSALPKTTPSHKPPLSAAATALAAKQQVLEQQIAEQKALMASLDSASPPEKKAIMARLRKLAEELKPAPLPELSTPKVDTMVREHQKKERERLDQELELHGAGANGREEDGSETLNARLDRLKAEAASLGIQEATPPPLHGSGHRPYRGRARGGRVFRGAMRGGPPPRASMKLDNRPKKLLVRSVNEDGIQALREWYGTAAQLESLERTEAGDAIVAFSSRAAAEQGLAKGNNIPTIGSMQITWFTGKTPTLALIPKTAPETMSSTPDTVMKEPIQVQSSTQSHSPHGHEEEVVASGWGEDGDGEDGMGML